MSAALTPRRHPWYPFLLEAESTHSHSAAGRITSMKNPSDPLGNGTHDLPACSTMLQPSGLHDVKYLCPKGTVIYCLGFCTALKFLCYRYMAHSAVLCCRYLFNFQREAAVDCQFGCVTIVAVGLHGVSATT